MPESRRLRSLLRQFGPGLVTGAADDDPSGIATYSQAGAQLGCAGCWILLLCYPMMVATQEISARIGRATGGGIVAALRTRYPRWVVYLVVGLIAFANTVNLGADLGAMAEVFRLLIGGPRLAYVALFGALCAGLLIRLRLRLYMRFVKWAALSLSVYVLAAIHATSSWGALLRLPAPSVLLDRSSIATLVVAVMGTTISPYLFIWQSSLEGERACGMPKLQERDAAVAAGEEAWRIRADTFTGMAVATIVAYAVVVTAASTLHASGITAIETTAQAAEQLRQLAGPLTHILFSLGILATGLLAVPMLAGSAAFAVGEALGRPVGLARMPGEVPAFHGCILAAMAAGVVMNMFGANVMRVLLWSAVINGVLAAPVLVAMMLVATRREMMGWLALSPLLAALGWVTTAAMGAGALGLLVTLWP
jgi:Mn2+/Fe2+ NRAMP family transporter